MTIFEQLIAYNTNIRRKGKQRGHPNGIPRGESPLVGGGGSL